MADRQFAKNITAAFTAQFFNYAFSIVASLVIPKMLGMEHFGYWQLFIFYSTYVGLLHFGLSDGIYLKYGGYEPDRLPTNLIGGQFIIMVAWQMAIGIVGAIAAMLYCGDPNRQFVWMLTAIYMVIVNATWFWGYVFQAVNFTRLYSGAVIISKAGFLISIIVMSFVKVSSYKPFIACYVVAQGAAMFFMVYLAKKNFEFGRIQIRESFSALVDNIKIGINLTLSNIVSSFILGVGRVMVDHTSGIKTFGILSLSITLCNFFLQFITQISMVLFPALKKVDHEVSTKMYICMRKMLGYLGVALLVVYLPIAILLKIWLPNYSQSIYYLIFLLPICVYDAKMQLLYNTYLKMYRKERLLLKINVITLAFSTLLCLVSVFGFKSITLVALSMMLAISFRSIVANYFVGKIVGVNEDDNIFFEVLFTIVFVAGNCVLSDSMAFCIYIAILIVYISLRKTDIKESLDELVFCYSKIK
ncbi:lipopolysaccharide biosynthesis protein [Butyrivibrio sp. MC2013]|uniref:lipopolysaccharide biosynthesis protein n=1 Tax=Butyrivibrio sp. MC2013 TaxID=1280686 RepID=UPI00041CAE49|nr:hypothetical protein [Butyrivibrio sp. MC2013]